MASSIDTRTPTDGPCRMLTARNISPAPLWRRGDKAAAMRVDELDYQLPPELIADRPAARRPDARLMLVRLGGQRVGGPQVEHLHIRDLPGLLKAGDLLLFNQTRVIPARFHAIRLKTGGHVEGLFLKEPDKGRWQVMLKAKGHLQAGESLALTRPPDRPAEDRDEQAAALHRLELLERNAEGHWLAKLQSGRSTFDLLEAIGQMPLPPYIEKQRKQPTTPEAAPEATAESNIAEPFPSGVGRDQAAAEMLDRERYQTVYAREPGAIAAPTAGLHFTPELLAKLDGMGIERRFVTLHVGLGTFAPVRAARLEDHPMHSEWFKAPGDTLAALSRARREGRRLIAIGTTTVRSLESLPQGLVEGLDAADEPPDFTADTRLLIQPGFTFRHTDGLLTNFHLPRSTLLALVAAITGLERLKELYQLAIAQKYRFFSYGDAMLILP